MGFPCRQGGADGNGLGNPRLTQYNFILDLDHCERRVGMK